MANPRSALSCYQSFLLLIIILVLVFSPQGFAEGHQKGIKQLHFVHKDVIERMKTRRLLQVAHLDYDDAGPNPRHDPRRGRGGGVTRNL